MNKWYLNNTRFRKRSLFKFKSQIWNLSKNWPKNMSDVTSTKSVECSEMRYKNTKIFICLFKSSLWKTRWSREESLNGFWIWVKNRSRKISIVLRIPKMSGFAARWYWVNVQKLNVREKRERSNLEKFKGHEWLQCSGNSLVIHCPSCFLIWTVFFFSFFFHDHYCQLWDSWN